MSKVLRKPRSLTKGPVTKMLVQAAPAVAPVFAFSVLINLLRLTVPLYMLQVIDRVLSSESSETLAFLTILAVGALVTSGILVAMSSHVTSAIGAWVDERVYPRLVVRALLAPANVNPQTSTSGLRDVGQLRQLLSGQALATLFEIPWTVVFLAVLFLLHPNLGLLATAAAVILLVVASLDQAFVQPMRMAAQQEKEIASKGVERAAFGSDAIKAMGFHERLAASLARDNATTSAALDRATRRAATIQAYSRTIRTVAQVAVLGTGALLVLAGEITTGTMVAGSILLGLALSPIDKAIGTISSLRMLGGIVARLNWQLQRDEPAKPASPAVPETGDYKLVLRQATFMPEGMRRPVLRPLNFEVEAGDVLGVFGPVGAGKSTLARLLAGVIQPSAGTVLLNDVSMAQMSGSEVRDRFGYLPQQGTVLPGTIVENISRFAEGEASAIAKAAAKAATMAGVHNAILGLPDGYETRLNGIDDVVLSQGQLQQILIARTFYGDPDLIVLDEPTIWLDKSAEESLSALLQSAMDRRATLIMVTQKPSLLKLCGRLLHLRDGRVVDLGDKAEVLERVGAGNVTGQPRRVKIPQRNARGGGGGST
jgi:PrtD family type I secretion system ABC transporter